MPSSLLSCCAYFFRSFGANQSFLSQLWNDVRAASRAMWKGRSAFGLMSLAFVLAAMMSEPQNGHWNASACSGRVTSAPQLPHRAVSTSTTSLLCSCNSAR
jgi:hypothetical protein